MSYTLLLIFLSFFNLSSEESSQKKDLYFSSLQKFIDARLDINKKVSTENFLVKISNDKHQNTPYTQDELQIIAKSPQFFIGHVKKLNKIIKDAENLDRHIRTHTALKALITHQNQNCNIQHNSLEDLTHINNGTYYSMQEDVKNKLLKLEGCTKNQCTNIPNCCIFSPTDHLPLIQKMKSTKASLETQLKKFDGVFEPELIDQIRDKYNINTFEAVHESTGCRTIKIGIRGFGGIWTPDACGHK